MPPPRSRGTILLWIYTQFVLKSRNFIIIVLYAIGVTKQALHILWFCVKLASLREHVKKNFYVLHKQAGIKLLYDQSQIYTNCIRDTKKELHI